MQPYHTAKTPPKPETKRAYLISAGVVKPTFTVHHYYETRLVTLPGPHGSAWEFIFKCFTTGAERRWGTAQGPEPVLVEDESEEGN